MIQTSRFCKYCSNPNTTDGSYQEIGCFSIMEKMITGNFICTYCYSEEVAE